MPHLHTQPYLVIYQCGEGQIVKEICEVLPNIGISVFPQTLIVEAVHLCDLSALVVPSEDCDALPVAYLKQADTIAMCEFQFYKKLKCVRTF